MGFLLNRIGNLLLFLIIIIAYLYLPISIVRERMVPPEKKLLFREAREWQNKYRVKKQKFEEEKKAIEADKSLLKREKTARIKILQDKLLKDKHKKGKKLHKRLLDIGITLDIPILIGCYFILGFLIFLSYRYLARKSKGIAKIQYAVYLAFISLLLIITTFGFSYSASFIYNPDFWHIQKPPHYVSNFIEENPMEATPFIASHFVIFALNASIMGPFDAYMTVKPFSLPASLMQFLQRLFVIGVLLPSIYKLWFRFSSTKPVIIREEQEQHQS